MTAAPARRTRASRRLAPAGTLARVLVLGAWLSLVLPLTAAAAAPAAGGQSRNPLRIFTPLSLALVQDAIRVSETVRALVDELAVSDLVVIVQVTDEPVEYAGTTIFVTCAGGFRYVQIRVNGRIKPWDKIAVLGHELQHAVEVARAPEVVDEATLARLMTRIGRTVRKGTFETDAAIAVLRRVEAEVKGH